MSRGRGHLSLAFLLQRLRRRRRAEAVIERHYPAWLSVHGQPDQTRWRSRLAATPGAPPISVVMPVYNTAPDHLAAAIGSVRQQFHSGWELVIADDASNSSSVHDLLAEAQSADARIRVLRLPQHGGISAASNAGIAAASHGYVAFLDHDDLLAPHALAAMACELAEFPATALAFSDEDQIEGTRRVRPYFKPGWNPDLLRAQNLICHLAVYRRDLLQRCGALRPEFDGSQDFDLALRLSTTGAIRHVPDILYHWRQTATSFSASQAEACRQAGIRALADTLGQSCRVTIDPDVPQWPRTTPVLPETPPRVTLIGGSPRDYSYAGPLDYASRPDDATGDVLLFLSAALRPSSPDWIDILVAEAMRPEIGAAGARLDGPNGRVLHAGFSLDPAAIVQSARGLADEDDPGYRGLFHLARTVSALGGDCLAIRRDVFLAAGGFRHQAGDFASVDLCLRLPALGLRCIWQPQARLRYTVMPSRPASGAAWMRACWGDKLAHDPYINPNLRQDLGGTSRPPQTPVINWASPK